MASREKWRVKLSARTSDSRARPLRRLRATSQRTPKELQLRTTRTFYSILSRGITTRRVPVISRNVPSDRRIAP